MFDASLGQAGHYRELRGAGNWDTVAEDFAARTMTGRIGEPEDIANAVAFLAAPELGWTTAQVLTGPMAAGWSTPATDENSATVMQPPSGLSRALPPAA